ncbi:YkvA family protein [Aeromonas media]|uniref:DUF1232 domain-containing protein n=1 Tax=Aeromonas media TaxID=651 RepID=A0AAE6SHW2_AERME|nr:DUF1232 domain-containing protein [Aeromonas media]QHQ50874.1 DUF1232 domain-containing protein [Aeromonas media]
MSNPSHSDIMRKLKDIKGIKELLEKAVLLYVLLTDGDLPVWCYALIIGALAYLVNPFDVVPDPIPFAGYLDDLSVITSALGKVRTSIPRTKNENFSHLISMGYQ